MIQLESNTGTQLSYGLNITPSPLQASLTTAEITAVIQIIAVNQTGSAVNLEALAIQVEIGENASDLSAKTSSALTANIQPSTPWQSVPVTTGDGPNTYKWTPPLLSVPVTLDANDSVVITFNNVPINTEIGTTELSITETPQGASPQLVKFSVTKFPFGFFFTGLKALELNANQPVSQVPYNGQVRLKWTGSLTDVQGYKVYYSTNAGQVSSAVTTLGQWTSPPLTNNTIFTVYASSENAEGETVTAELTTGVVVQNPDLVATSLSLGGQPPITSFDQVLPPGTIVMWSGALANIPAGWALCDGTNGTPNLISRFIFGAGDPTNPNTPNAVTPNNTGGAESHAHTATAQVVVDTAGAHHHLVNGIWGDTVKATLTLTSTGADVVQGIGAGWARTATSDGTVVGDHTHPASSTVTVNSASNMPPWVALAFIMKTS